jgi:hypothetical protein
MIAVENDHTIEVAHVLRLAQLRRQSLEPLSQPAR